jgi:hypothetical protein
MKKKRDAFVAMLQEQVALLQAKLRGEQADNLRLLKENRQLRDRVIKRLLTRG